MWDISSWIAWAIAAAIFLWLAFDFIRVNAQFQEDVLVSSREGLDELFQPDDSKGKKK